MKVLIINSGIPTEKYPLQGIFEWVFGVAYVEALAAGLPIIATKCGGPEDFVDDSNGILVEVDNIKQNTDAIVKIYSNISNYKEEDLKDFVKSRFSPNVVANKLQNIYKGI